MSCIPVFASYWLRKPWQLVALIVGLSIATAMWTGVQAINNEAKASYDTAASLLTDGQYDQLVPKQGKSIPQKTYIALRRAGWLVSPVIEDEIENIRFIGLDRATVPFTRSHTTTQFTRDLDTSDSRQRLYIHSETAKHLELSLPLEIDDTLPLATVIGDVGVIQTILQRDDLSRLLVSPNQPLNQSPLNQITNSLILQSAQQTADLSQLTQSFRLNLTAVSLLSFTVGLFIVYSTVGLTFEQRNGLIQVLRVLGVPLREVIVILVLEALLIAIISAVLGILIGYLIAASLLPDVAATLRGLYGAQIPSSLTLRGDWWLSGIGMALFGTTVAFADRIWQLNQTPLLATSRPRLTIAVNAIVTQRFAYAAFIFLCVTLLTGIFFEGLLAGFLVLGGMLLTAAFWLPLILRWMLEQLRRFVSSAYLSWFLADIRHQLPSLNLALMALLLAVSTSIGVSTMVSSFRVTFVDFLNQRLAPELFVEVESVSQSQSLINYLARTNHEALPLVFMTQQLAGETVDLLGIVVGPTYREHWTFLNSTDTVWDSVDSGSAVMINEQLAQRSGLKVGDSVAIDLVGNKPIAAIIADYGNPNGQIIAASGLIQSIDDTLYARQFGIRTQHVDATKKELIRAIGLAPGQFIDQASLKTTSMKVFDRTFTVTKSLNILTMIVASLSLLITLFTLLNLRLASLSIVWALGFTWQKITWSELVRAIVLTALISICALPTGLGLAWVLLNIVNVEAFGWQLPMHFFPSSYVQIIGLALISASIATLWPTYYLQKNQPSTLLKIFSNER